MTLAIVVLAQVYSFRFVSRLKTCNIGFEISHFLVRFYKKIHDWILNPKNSKPDFAFLNSTDQSKISQIMVRQRNGKIHFRSSLDAPRSERSWTELFS